jgi:hypothetical protein
VRLDGSQGRFRATRIADPVPPDVARFVLRASASLRATGVPSIDPGIPRGIVIEGCYMIIRSRKSALYLLF